MRINQNRKYGFRWRAIVAVGVLLIPGFCLTARHRRRRHHRRHYTHVHIKPERVEQIQQALIKAGYLHDKPDGIWGPDTRDAMREYQKANGFTPTGLPEAKPLMKLGLGPHSLPPAAEPSPPPQAENQGQTKTGTASSSPPAKKHPASNP